MPYSIPTCCAKAANQFLAQRDLTEHCFIFTDEQDQETDQVPQTLSPDLSFNKSDLNDCPRDSGCYISPENSDNSKEDLDAENLSDLVQAITIAESN